MFSDPEEYEKWKARGWRAPVPRTGNQPMEEGQVSQGSEYLKVQRIWAWNNYIPEVL